jgi:hypothetical protein
MSFSDGIWKMERNSPGFSQRYEGKMSRDGNTIASSWEKSLDGQRWEHDLTSRIQGDEFGQSVAFDC